MLTDYIQRIAKTTAQQDAREESYYDTLKLLLEQYATAEAHISQVHITVLPKGTEAGNPDFRIWDGQNSIIGYIEAKKPGANLDQVERGDQLTRYRDTFPNLILTDFFEYRLYRNGEKVDTVLLARPFVATKLKAEPPLENTDGFLSLLGKFFSFAQPRVFTAEALAAELAKRTRFLRDEIIKVELAQEAQQRGSLYGFYQAFREFLIADLPPADFADIYAQTVTYGLFAARTRSTNGFNRRLAYDRIPKTIGILRDMFRFISLGSDLPLALEVIVDDIAAVLHLADAKAILHQYYKSNKGDDPVVHFYETFLAEYDPATRERRGVYYTPEPVVRYIVRSLHQLLQEKFDLNDGLASEGVRVLDPAAGTLTFPAEAIKLAVQEHVDRYGSGNLHRFISKQVLPHWFAFELMMAPYAIGHIKMSFLLEELGYTLSDDERFRLYLTNALDMREANQSQFPGTDSLSEENRAAAVVKREEPILVIMGNPPYSGQSSNSPALTEDLMNKKHSYDGLTSYYQVDGESINERNAKWLQDDYVKFIRFAQWKINRAQQGVVGMITNHSYLDNPTFRGMRQSLMHTFHEIYVLDLHGNAKKREADTDGGRDQNVFDIQQGVSIVLMVKRPKAKGCQVYHADLFGTRKHKTQWLDANDRLSTAFQELKPQSPWYFFVPHDTDGLLHYQDWIGLQELFPVNSVGIVTARDKLTIHATKEAALETARRFADMEPELARQVYKLGPDARDWKVKLAQEDLQKTKLDPDNIKPILYRPFDKRFTYFTGNSRGFHCMPRGKVMQHMLKENVGLTVVRQVKSSPQWEHALVTNGLTESTYLSNRTSEIGYLFPLYLYPQPKSGGRTAQKAAKHMVFEPEINDEVRHANILPAFYDRLAEAYNNRPTPEQILHYVYAVLYSPAYRARYEVFLKIDFPRIPFTTSWALFEQMAANGAELCQLHLLTHPKLDRPSTRYHGAGSDEVTKVSYHEAQQRVYINANKYFDNITPELWNFQVGGYQVLDKFLKDRKGQSLDDAVTYCRIATALSLTLKWQADVDVLFAQVERDTIRK